jgi:hypothetical protein
MSLHPAVNSFNRLRSRFFTGWSSINLGLRRLLTVLPMTQTPVYHGLESWE